MAEATKEYQFVYDAGDNNMVDESGNPIIDQGDIDVFPSKL